MRLRASVQSEGELIIQLPREPMQLVANVSVLRRKGSQDDDDDNNGEREGRRALRSARPRLQLCETTKRQSGLIGDGDWDFSSDLRLLPGETELRVRLFFDHTIAEIGAWRRCRMSESSVRRKVF
jgi:hypothetical protein